MKDFDDFFCYIEQRTNSSKIFIGDCELAYFAKYIMSGLKTVPNVQIGLLSPNTAQIFDYHFYYHLSNKFLEGYGPLIAKISRNNFCYCGSGNKYKDCCG